MKSSGRAGQLAVGSKLFYRLFQKLAYAGGLRGSVRGVTAGRCIVCGCVCAARFFFLCVCFVFLFVLSFCFFFFFFLGCFFFFFFQFFSGVPLLGGFYPSFSCCLTRAAFINLPPFLSPCVVVERNCVGC